MSANNLGGGVILSAYFLQSCNFILRVPLSWILHKWNTCIIKWSIQDDQINTAMLISSPYMKRYHKVIKQPAKAACIKVMVGLVFYKSINKWSCLLPVSTWYEFRICNSTICNCIFKQFVTVWPVSVQSLNPTAAPISMYIAICYILCFKQQTKIWFQPILKKLKLLNQYA